MQLRRSWNTPAMAAFSVVLGPLMVFGGITGDYSPEDRITSVFFGLLLPLGSAHIWRRETREPQGFGKVEI